LATQTSLHPAYNLALLREQFEITATGMAYLNHAGMSPLPTPARNAMQEALEAFSREGAAGYDALDKASLDTLYRLFSLIVGADPEEIAVVANTATGVNLIANSLPLQPGDSVLLCSTEFPSNVYPWMNLARRGIETIVVPSADGGLSLELLDQHRDKRSRVVAVSAVQFLTGRREDLAQIGAYCEQYGLWLVVDAMQAAGVVPIDMRTMGIHALAAGSQKALMGPPGIGLLAVRAELLEQMHPVFAGPLSVEGWEHWLQYDLTFRPKARRFDCGTHNVPGQVGLATSMQLLANLGIDNIASWVTRLSNVAIRDLTSRGYRVITPEDPAHHAHIVTIVWDGDAHTAVDYLRKHGVLLCAHQNREGTWHLRLSSHCYNTQEEILCVGDLLEGVRHEQH